MKNHTHPAYKSLLILFTITLFPACAGQPQGQRVVVVDSIPVTYPQALAAYDAADSRESLLLAIDALERYAKAHPRDYASRARLANAYTLLGAGYSEGVTAKAAAYDQAMTYALAAFNTDGRYQLARINGQGFAGSLALLDESQMEAMEFWKTAMFYSFREASGLLGQLWRFPRLKQAVAVMERQEAIDRNAMWGNNLMSWGIYYLAQPEWYGGDREKSRAYLAEAAAVSERNIVPRWGRAKYFAVAMDDVQMFRTDLQWVAAQPLAKLEGYRPWNVLLQREARALLTQESNYFNSAD